MTRNTENPPLELVDEPAEKSPADLSQELKVSLLKVMVDAVNTGTGNGVDIVLARQAADVYAQVFGMDKL